MNKLDLAKTCKQYYSAINKPELIEIEPAQFLSVTGKGDPSGRTFSEKIQALYSVAYTIKFDFKAKSQDFVVAKLEGLWWFDDTLFNKISMSDAPTQIPRDEWEYRLLIRMPDFVIENDVQAALSAVFEKKKIEFAREVELFEMDEGKCVQMLHTGPFDKEPETLLVIQEFIQKNNFQKNGLHHEIYLSDFRKTAPEKLKTILREPVK